MTTFEESIQAAQEILERLKQAAPRLSRPARHELLRRLKDMNVGMARASAAQQVDNYLERSRNGNLEDVEQAITKTISAPERSDQPDTGGQRGSGAFLHGQELPREEED